MSGSDGLKVGDRVVLSGGYDMEPAWLGGVAEHRGTVLAFHPGTNEGKIDAVVKLDQPLTFGDTHGDILVLKLRYVGQTWTRDGTVHLELCDFMPEAKPWRERRQGKWIESHARYERER